jgi:hypothetical protein
VLLAGQEEMSCETTARRQRAPCEIVVQAAKSRLGKNFTDSGCEPGKIARKPLIVLEKMAADTTKSCQSQHTTTTFVTTIHASGSISSLTLSV